jgi:hypothetical protein
MPLGGSKQTSKSSVTGRSAMMYSFFRLTTGITGSDLIDPTPYLEANGFVRTA